MSISIEERMAMGVITQSENFLKILKELNLQYASRSVENSAHLTKMIADIAEKAIVKSNEDRAKADGMLYLLTCVMHEGTEKIDENIFPFLLEVMQYRYPEGYCDRGCKAETELFGKFIELFKSKEVNKRFLDDEDWLKVQGFKAYVDVVKSKLE